MKTLAISLFASAIYTVCSAQVAESTVTKTIVVVVNGPVVNAGRYTLPEGATIKDAIAAAGGISTTERASQATLIHSDSNHKPQLRSFNLNKLRDGSISDPGLHEGDTVAVGWQCY